MTTLLARLLWTFALLVALAPDALAWGPSAHLWIGDRILTALAGSLPLVGGLLVRHARAFLYGAIAPDFFVGKGSKGHERHCHNWASAHRLLEAAKTDAEKAFAYGYLTHLAADVVGHNCFVPNQLFRSQGSAKLGHVIWELHADSLLDRGYAQIGRELARVPLIDQDGLLRRTLVAGNGGRLAVPLGARKGLFTAYLRVHASEPAARLLARTRPYAHARLRDAYEVDRELRLSLAHAVLALEDPEHPLLARWDPIGAENLALAKRLQGDARRDGTYSHASAPFPVPPELDALGARLLGVDDARTDAAPSAGKLILP